MEVFSLFLSFLYNLISTELFVRAASLLALFFSLIACSNTGVIQGVGRLENLEVTVLRGAYSSKTEYKEDLKKCHISSISSNTVITCHGTKPKDSLTTVQSHLRNERTEITVG